MLPGGPGGWADAGTAIAPISNATTVNNTMMRFICVSPPLQVSAGLLSPAVVHNATTLASSDELAMNSLPTSENSVEAKFEKPDFSELRGRGPLQNQAGLGPATGFRPRCGSSFSVEKVPPGLSLDGLVGHAPGAEARHHDAVRATERGRVGVAGQVQPVALGQPRWFLRFSHALLYAARGRLDHP